MDQRVGTLGSALTFAGQATGALRRVRPGLGVPEYFPTMDDVVAAVLGGAVDVGVLTSETSNTASTETVARILAGEKLFVTDEIVVPYRCALLGRPGSRVEQITHVGGHGSIRQCEPFLRERLPHATIAVHRQNSVVAAREVLAGDGSTAVIGTEAAAAALGLEILERDVDRGSVAGWWALAASLRVPADGDHVAVRVEGIDEFDAVIGRARDAGLRLRTVTNAASGELFRYRYLLVLRSTEGPVGESIVDALGPDVVGVFTTTSSDHTVGDHA